MNLLVCFQSKVLKYLDEIEERLITEVESVQEKHEEKINKEKHNICLLTSILKDNKQELEFVKEHGICTWYYSNTPRSTGKRYFIFIGFVILVYIYLIMKIITK
jgi:hypothetical protein